MTLTTDRDENEVEFVEDPRERCALNVDSFVDEQEWKLHKYIHVWTKTREEAYKNTKNKHPCFSAATKASRRPEFFIWNILVVMVSQTTRRAFVACSSSSEPRLDGLWASRYCFLWRQFSTSKLARRNSTHYQLPRRRSRISHRVFPQANRKMFSSPVISLFLWEKMALMCNETSAILQAIELSATRYGVVILHV